MGFQSSSPGQNLGVFLSFLHRHKAEFSPLFLSILFYVWFLFLMPCFFSPSLTPSSLFFPFYPLIFLSFCFFFYCLFAFDLCLVVQDHLTFLSFSVHRMLYYKVALGTKGRPNLRTCDAFGGHGDLFIYHMHLEKLEKTPQKTARSQLGK